jgi:hypothetical protein
MRKVHLFCVFALLAAVLVLPFAARADHHVLGSLRIEPAPEWGRRASDLVLPREWWFGRDAMSFAAQDWRYVFDKSRGRILVINNRDKYVVAVAMTADTPDIVDPGYLEALGRTQVFGTVAKSYLTRTVLGAECLGTAISEWMISAGEHVYDRDRMIYACNGVPFDWRMFRDLSTWMVSFFNPQMAYFGGLRSIEGFPLAETDIYTRNTLHVSYGVEITAIQEGSPPAGIYEIPAGYTRRDKLTQRDIQAMRQIQYLAYSY